MSWMLFGNVSDQVPARLLLFGLTVAENQFPMMDLPLIVAGVKTPLAPPGAQLPRRIQSGSGVPSALRSTAVKLLEKMPLGNRTGPLPFCMPPLACFLRK